IELDTDGPTPNDDGDSDTGANSLQNFPEILSALVYPTRTVLQGTLSSRANATYRVEFFDTDELDPSGNCDGRTFLGTTNLTIGMSGAVNFNLSLALLLTNGHYVTATATDSSNNTSEFSFPALVTPYDAADVAIDVIGPDEAIGLQTNVT